MYGFKWGRLRVSRLAMNSFRVLALVSSILFAGAASASAQSVTSQATAAHASTPLQAVDYGGGVAPGIRRAGIILSLRRDGSGLTARVGLVVTCRRVNFPQIIARGSGTITGSSFTATFRTRIDRGLRLRTRLRGTFAGDGATGTVAMKPIRGRGGPRGCRGFPQTRIVLRAAGSPAGAAAKPAPRTVVRGLTTQDDGGLHLPVMLTVSSNGRHVVALWLALAGCGRFNTSIANFTPRTRIRSNGSFSKPERYVIRYNDGTTDRFRIAFSGRFLSDGAVGTLRVRVRTTNRRGRVLVRCDSGPHTFTAR